MSDANRTAFRMAEETTFNVVPTAPRFKTLRVKSGDLSFNPITKVSDELVADRMVPDLIRVGLESGGGLPMEASYGNLHDPIKLALMSDWIRKPVRDNDGAADSVITAVDGSGVYTVITGAGTEINDGTFVVGQLAYFTNFTAANNNGLKRVTTGGATSVTAAGASTVEAAPPATARIKVVGVQGSATEISCTATSIVFATLNPITLGFLPGEWVKVGGNAAGDKFATAACNGWCRVSTVTSTTVNFDRTPVGMTTDAGTSQTIQVFFGDVIRNGTTKRSVSVEVEHQDLAAPEYDVYSGMRAAFEISGASQDILQAKATFTGANATNSTTRTASASTIAAPTNEVMNTSSNVGELREAGALIGGGVNLITDFMIGVDNTYRRQKAIGSVPDIGIGAGRVRVKGKFTMYYENNSVRTKILAGTASSFAALFRDPAGLAGYHVDVPRLKYENGNPSVPGVDTDRMMDPSWEGLKDPTLGYVIQYSRFDYLST